jgi:DNA-directed RNA polymerase specialized sigma24 family protein
MARPEEFAAFVSADSDRLRAFAFLLTLEADGADAFVEAAMAKAWAAWPRVREDPEPFVRAAVVTAFAARWRALRDRWFGSPRRAPLPVPTAPEEPAAARRRRLWDDLGRLPRRTRAVVVLASFDDLDEPEIARTVATTVGTVRRDLRAAHDVLGFIPGDVELTELLAAFGSGAPWRTEFLPTVLARLRRRRLRVAAAVAAAVVVGAGFLSAKALPGQRPASRAAAAVPAVPAYPHIFSGGVVLTQFGGNGASAGSATIVWPGGAMLGGAWTCGGGFGLTADLVIAINGRPVTAACMTNAWLPPGSWANEFAAIPAGTRVAVTISTHGAVGKWSLALLGMDPRWVADTTTVAAQLGADTGLGYFPDYDSFTYTAHGTRPSFVLECSQAGRMSFRLNGVPVGTVSCPDQTWAAVPWSPTSAELVAIGWRPETSVTLTLRWSPAPFGATETINPATGSIMGPSGSSGRIRNLPPGSASASPPPPQSPVSSSVPIQSPSGTGRAGGSDGSTGIAAAQGSEDSFGLYRIDAYFG